MLLILGKAPPTSPIITAAYDELGDTTVQFILPGGEPFAPGSIRYFFDGVSIPPDAEYLAFIPPAAAWNVGSIANPVGRVVRIQAVNDIGPGTLSPPATIAAN